MTVGEMCESGSFEAACLPKPQEEIKGIYCGDLLSNVMVKAPENCAWITVIGNVNTSAVAFAANAACVVLAENAEADELMLSKAREHKINVIKTALPEFEAALEIYGRLNPNS